MQCHTEAYRETFCQARDGWHFAPFTLTPSHEAAVTSVEPSATEQRAPTVRDSCCGTARLSSEEVISTVLL